MKILIILLFTSFSCYSQNFMMKMNIIESYMEGTISRDTTKVIWRLEGDKKMSILWADKMINLNSSASNPTKQQRKIIKRIRLEYKEKARVTNRHIKIQSLYISDQNEVFFVTIYIKEGILIWVKRLDEKFPCYFFRMVT